MGRGAFGSVYRVRRRNAEGIYAMKELPLKDLDRVNGENNNLFDEIDILKRLKHPHIVEYHSSFIEEGSLYIGM